MGGTIIRNSAAESDADESLDVLGYLCPMPVKFTRSKLLEMESGKVLEIIADDPETKVDIPKLVERLGCTLINTFEKSGVFHFIVRNAAKPAALTNISETEIPSDARLPTKFGEFRIRVFKEEGTGLEHAALTLGEMNGPDSVLVRVHSECLTGDAFGSMRCDCGPQLEQAMLTIQEKGWGCIIYLRQEGRGIGLHEKIKAYHLQDRGMDTLDANLVLGHPGDAREYDIASQILSALDIREISLLTNNPDKVDQLIQNGISVSEMVPLVAGVGKDNVEYLATKITRMGHKIDAEQLNEN